MIAMTRRKGDTFAKSVAFRPVVQEFLDEMAAALTSGDGKAAAALWSLPAILISDAGVESVDTVEQLEELFGGAREHYNELGITSTRGEIEDVDWLTEMIVRVDVRWPWLDKNGDRQGSECSSYVLRRGDDGRLRMHVAVMRGTENVNEG
jgi:hypothetical protein